MARAIGSIVSWASAVKLGIMPEDAVLVEGDAALGGEIGCNSGTLRDGVSKRDDARHATLDAPHGAREGVPQAFDELEKRQIGIRRARAKEPVAAAVPLDDPLEVPEELRDAVADEVRSR